ncbi:MAG: SRPBCC family protein [Chlorobiaceae bacterium]
MEPHHLTYIYQLPVSIDTAWNFFSNPGNLVRITPPEMMVTIISQTGEQCIYEGMIVTYTLYPFMMIPVKWETEITQVLRPCFFEDFQKSGPYEYWCHQHFFREIDGGVEMIDSLQYSLPMGFFGEIVNTFIVSRRLEEVFAYRREKIEKILGYM